MVLLFFVFFLSFLQLLWSTRRGKRCSLAKIGMIFYIINVYIQNMMKMIVTGKNMLHRIFVSDYCYY